MLDISGGTNVSFSLSYEYLDQVLLPTLEERWGVVVERKLKHRAWSFGTMGRGEITIKIHPLLRGQKLQFRPTREQRTTQSREVRSIDVSIIIPTTSHATLQDRLIESLSELFPSADINFKVVENSGNVARWYVLLVGHSVDGTRLGRDILTSMPKKTKSEETFTSKLSTQICKSLYEEVLVGGWLDEHLQDQVVCLQALTDGSSSLPRREKVESEPTLTAAVNQLDIVDERVREEKAQEPFGHGSLHTQTARWVVSELLPSVKFFNKGDIVQGVGLEL